MRQLNFLLGFILLCSFPNCKSHKTPDELKSLFYQNKKQLDSFTTFIKSDKKLDSIFSNTTEEQGLTILNIKQTYPSIYNLLTNAGITEASSHNRTYPKTVKWYWLKTNWPSEYPIYLAYDTFNLTQTVKGYYNKDEAFNETWGLGDRWFMFRWVKDKDYKQ